MIISRRLKLHLKSGDKYITFGQADTADELEEVYRLRHSVYSKRGYIDSKNYSDGIEKDEYDTLGKCHYFIARFDNQLIGAIRIIIDDPLPTEKHFEFEEPEQIRNIPRKNRCELGRFIIIPPNTEACKYLPRGLVRLFLLDVLASFGADNGLYGGYAFVKKSLEIKMKKMKMPIGEIGVYKQNYPKGGDLYKYFTQSNDPVIPIYFLTKDFQEYSKKHIHNSIMFKDEGDGSFILKSNLYTSFLKVLKII